MSDPIIESFLPASWHNRNILDRLNYTIDRAQALYAAVAYWTVGPQDLSPQLLYLLRQPASFCCVDLHFPTNVDKLLAFHQHGATLRLFCRKVGHSSEAHLHHHLLHTKLLVFDLPNQQAEIWVGSHNFTKQALLGANREASVILTCAQDSALYRQVLKYLRAIRDERCCEPFSPARLDEYKQLQGLDTTEPEPECYVLPILWNSHRPATDPLTSLRDQTALLVGRDPEIRKSLARIYAGDIPLIVWAYDLATSRVSYWTAEIQNTGEVTPDVQSSYDIQFGHPLLAVHQEEALPYLSRPTQPLDAQLLQDFRFYASIWLYEEATEQILLTPPPARGAKARWVKDVAATDEFLRQSGRWDDSVIDSVMLDLASVSSRESSASIALREFMAEVPAEARTILQAGDWLQKLAENLARQRARRASASRTSRLPSVLRPEFSVQSAVPLDALETLRSDLANVNQKLRQIVEEPIIARYFDRSSTARLPQLDRSVRLPIISKLLSRYRILIIS